MEWADRTCVFYDMEVVEMEQHFVIIYPTYNDIRAGYDEILEKRNMSYSFEEKQISIYGNLIIKIHRQRDELVKSLQLD